MIPHSAAWDAYPATSYRPAVRVTAYDLPSGLGVDVPVTDGWVLKDAGQYPRQHAAVTCADTSLVPTTPSSYLAPTGNYLRIEAGYTDSAGVTTYITIHDGPITRVAAQRPGGLLQIESADASVTLTSLTSYVDSTPAYATIVGYINNLQGAGIPYGGGLDTSSLTAAQIAQPLPAGYVRKSGTSAWAEIEAMADLLGAEAYVNTARWTVLRPTPNVGAPVYTFATGESGTITEYESAAERAVNQVYLVYSNGIVGYWADVDPSSPTRVTGSGAFGLSNLVESRQGEPTQTEANAAAKEYARRVRGNGRGLTVRAVPVPWLEPGDTVNVAPIGQRVEQHLLQSVSIPLGLDVMTVTTRNPSYTGTL